MKQITAAFKAHLARRGVDEQTTVSCTLTVKTDGTVQGFTAHDQPITYDLESYLTAAGIHIPAQIVGSGSQVYAASSGYAATDISTGSDMQTDELEINGPAFPPSLTEAVLQQGDWDFAFYIIFWVNFADLTNTMGAVILRCGNIGKVTITQNQVKAELHGLTKAYTRNIGELTSESCRAILYDSRCKVNPATFTFTGTLTDVGDDDLTIYDSGRTEPGPAGGVNITAITNANPGHVSTDAPIGIPDGGAITISDVIGMTQVNVVTIVRNPTDTGFDLTVDTSDTASYPAYISGGTATPLGADSGYFDFGVITFTSGDNNGESMEIKSYVPGQITLQLPMPFTPQIGDTYSIRAGCNKSFSACKNKFSNVVNMRAETYLPGIDKILQIGKPSS